MFKAAWIMALLFFGMHFAHAFEESLEYDAALAYIMECDFERAADSIQALVDMAQKNENMQYWHPKIDELRLEMRARQDAAEQAEKKLEDAQNLMAEGQTDQAYLLATQAKEIYSKINHAQGERLAEQAMMSARVQADKIHHMRQESAPKTESTKGFGLPWWTFMVFSTLLILVILKHVMGSLPSNDPVRMSGHLTSGTDKKTRD